jgi:hypothetical protein
MKGIQVSTNFLDDNDKNTPLLSRMMTTGYPNVQASLSQRQFSFGEALWDSIIKPGMTPFLQIAMNLVFITLFLVLIFLVIATNFNVHVMMFLLISIMLFVSLQWYLGLLNSSSSSTPSSLLAAAATTPPGNNKETTSTATETTTLHTKKVN